MRYYDVETSEGKRYKSRDYLLFKREIYWRTDFTYGHVNCIKFDHFLKSTCATWSLHVKMLKISTNLKVLFIVKKNLWKLRIFINKNRFVNATFEIYLLFYSIKLVKLQIIKTNNWLVNTYLNCKWLICEYLNCWNIFETYIY